jgi:hypothetical protein
MKRPALLLTLLTLFSVLPLSIQAQEAELGPLTEVAIVKVDPGTLEDYLEVVGMVREAAAAANLDAQWGWQVWLRDFEVGIVSSVTDHALLFDDQAFWRALEGTAGEAMMAAALEKYEADVKTIPVSREVWEFEADWSYMPTEPGFEEPGFADMMEFWVKPGMEAEFEEMAVEVRDFLVRLGGPYPVNTFRPWFGDVGRMVYVVFLDDWSEYYGPSSMEAGIAASGLAEEWQALTARYMECLVDSRSSRWTFMSELSYQGSGM